MKRGYNLNKYTIQFSKDAKDDLTDIYSYIKYNLQEPNIANKLIQKIKQEIHKLKDYPIIYPIISDDFIKTLQLRKFKIKNYFVFYRVNPNNTTIEIVRVIHSRRNWTKLLS